MNWTKKMYRDIVIDEKGDTTNEKEIEINNCHIACICYGVFFDSMWQSK